MQLHFNIFPPKSPRYEHIVIFYISECAPQDLLTITQYVRSTFDTSLGTCYFFDWEYELMQGTFRIIMQRGVDSETTMQAMNDLKEKILTEFL